MELNSFLQQLQKRAVEKMLEGELDARLGYEKHQNTDNSNSSNGHSTQAIKDSFGEAEIKVARVRDDSFKPIFVPTKRKNMAEGVENVIISMYAKEMSNQDIEEQVR
ncbi:Transposase, Mutator family [Belliella pelovolcani]|uniref:Mutator family transposase n=1 Tax=Belliella pelovolcani TaxID=529505 RepID=A0A1N7MYV5_9BACT|nr:Transposase, Mutator family [Belliella pelovolcani]